MRTSCWGVSKRRMYKMKGCRQLRNAAVVAIEHYIYTSSSWGGSVVSFVVTHVVLIIIIIISRTLDLNSSCANRKLTTVSPAGMLVLITDGQNVHTLGLQFSDLNKIISFLFRLLPFKQFLVGNVFILCWKST